MELITIYRIEKHYLGPYRYGGNSRFSKYRNWKTKNHCNKPNPIQENLVSEDSHLKQFKCGFKSRTQLLKWFNKQELKNLEKLGFQLTIFETQKENVRIGKKQVIFVKKAKRYNTKNVKISQLFE